MIQTCQFDPGLQPVKGFIYTSHSDNSLTEDIRRLLAPKFVWLYLEEVGVFIDFPDLMGGILT